jgi:hypothetical protein
VRRPRRLRSENSGTQVNQIAEMCGARDLPESRVRRSGGLIDYGGSTSNSYRLAASALARVDGAGELRDRASYVAYGSCVTSIAGPHGAA